jgi:hypothetical protein
MMLSNNPKLPQDTRGIPFYNNAEIVMAFSMIPNRTNLKWLIRDTVVPSVLRLIVDGSPATHLTASLIPKMGKLWSCTEYPKISVMQGTVHLKASDEVINLRCEI